MFLEEVVNSMQVRVFDFTQNSSIHKQSVQTVTQKNGRQAQRMAEVSLTLTNDKEYAPEDVDFVALPAYIMTYIKVNGIDEALTCDDEIIRAVATVLKHIEDKRNKMDEEVPF